MYVGAGGSSLRGLVVLLAGAGFGLILAALVVAWDDGLSYGPPLLLGAYALSLADDSTAVDWAAPLVAVGLLALVEFGTWSLEFGDGGEERLFARLPSVLLLLGGGLAASFLVLIVGSARIEAGLILWVVGAAAALALQALIARLGPEPDRAP